MESFGVTWPHKWPITLQDFFNSQFNVGYNQPRVCEPVSFTLFANLGVDLT